MNITSFYALFTAGLIAYTSSALATPKVDIRAEIASPIILEKTSLPNYLKISLTGFPMETRARAPINLALVIDRSGSMSGENRIEHARNAAIMAVNLLEENDTLSVITYDDQIEVITPPTKVKNKEKIIAQIEEHINPRGSTALFGGLSKGIHEVSQKLDKEQINRVILLSDGQANIGPSSVSELSELARLAAKKGIAVTTIGMGDGYNEDLMTAVANYSDGNHAYVRNSNDLEPVFAHEFHDVMNVVAQDVEVMIKLDPSMKPVRLLGRDGDIHGQMITVRLNQLYSKQEKYVLLEFIPAEGKKHEEKPLAEIDVQYNNLDSKQKESWQNKLAIRYSDSNDEVKKANVEEVIIDSEIQKIALENERATKLIDEGKDKEAQEVLKSNSYRLSSIPAPTSDRAKEKYESAVEKNAQLESSAAANDKDVVRKELKESASKSKNQQSY